MVDPISILFKAAETIFSIVLNKASEKLFLKLRGGSAKKAFKKALGATVLRYATGERLALAHPFHKKKGLLIDPIVAEELSHIIRFERKPNAELIGAQWRRFYPNPPDKYNFTDEAKMFLEYFESELRETDVFGPVFNSKTLIDINQKVDLASVSLANIESHLSDRFDLMLSLFGNLAKKFAEIPLDISRQIRDYTRLIEEKTRGFVGREFVFNEIRKFTNTNPCGYFLIRGDPGIGKTTLAAQMVKRKGYVHHFNIRAEGINRAEAFLKNICAQLIAAYKLVQYSSLPPDATKDAGFLNDLLRDVSSKLASGEKAIIVVDALNEVDYASIPLGVNPLYLPTNLPKGVYLILTLQNAPINMRIECKNRRDFVIEQNSSENITDIREYVKKNYKCQGIKDYITTQSITEETFVKHIVEKSQGNFMYLHYVLPEIERGAYKDLSLRVIPTGLENYYDDHWRRMRGMDEEAWFKYKLPIVMALTVVKKAVSVDLIEKYSGIEERSRIRHVLHDWEAFLYKEFVEYEGTVQVRYRMYHDSFRDLIAKKEEVADERVDRKAAEAKISAIDFRDLYGKE